MSSPGRRDSAAAEPPSSTLVIQTAHLGDVVLTLPLLLRLAERHGPVDVITTPAALPLVETHPAVRHAIAFDKHRTARGIGALRRLGDTLRATGYARVILPHRSLRSAMLGWLTGAKERVGFSGTGWSFLYTRRVQPPVDSHAADRLLALAGHLGRPRLPWLTLSGDDRDRTQAWLAQHGVPSSFVVLAPGARWGTKRWPYFPELANAIDAPCVVIGAAEDAPLGAAIVAAAQTPGRIHSAVGALTLRQSAALIDRASVTVTNDSVALHLASALGRPVVALFGPTVPRFGFGPVGEDGIVIEHDGLACRPCSAHGPEVCPLGHHRCLREIGIPQVLAAITGRLQAIP